MDKLKPVLMLLYGLMFVLLPGCVEEKSPPFITSHEAKYPDIRKKYLYQSIIRIANINDDPDFDKLIKDIRKIIIYLPPSEDSTYQIKELATGMKADGYEELMNMRTADAARISLWVNESKPSSPHYVGLLDTEDEDIIFEIDGQLNLKYLSSLKMADQGSLLDLLN